VHGAEARKKLGGGRGAERQRDQRESETGEPAQPDARGGDWAASTVELSHGLVHALGYERWEAGQR